MRIRFSVLLLTVCLFASTMAGCDTTYVDSTNEMVEGIRLYNGGQVGKSLEHLRRAVEIYPNNHQAHFQMGMVYNGRLKDYPKAIESFKRAVEIQKENSEYWYYLGYAQQNLGGRMRSEQDAAKAMEAYNGAIVALEEAVRQDEYYAEAYYRIGQVEEELGEISKAIDAYTNAVNADPTLGLAYLGLGGLYSEYSFLNEAKQVLSNGAANDPTNVQLLAELGNAHLALEEYQEAISVYQKAYDTHASGKDSIEHVLPAIYGIGMAYTSLGEKALWTRNAPEAAKQFKEAIKWLDMFIANASGDSVAGQRVAATGKASDMKTMMRQLEKGEIPQVVLDQLKMNEESAAQGQP